jgi:ABC-type antimicrobial peptide transport system permease subunit
MLRNYFQITVRNLVRNKVYSCINIGGLAVGMAVAMLIGLWVWDELSFDKYHREHTQIALLQKNRNFNGTIITEQSHSLPLAAKLKESYGDYFEEVVASSYGGEKSLTVNDKTIIKRGLFMETGGEKILDLEILEGSPRFPLAPFEILISDKAKEALFGKKNATNQTVQIDKNTAFKIVGIFKSLPQNATYRSTSFYASMDSFAQMEEWVRDAKNSWRENSFPIYVKLAKNVSTAQISALIKDEVYKVTKDPSKPSLFLYPMDTWHLYPEYKNGLPVSTGKDNILIFGLIGILTMLLAAINFMNLSTARSEKRSKEIGVRKAVGSSRFQIVGQFYAETFLTILVSALFALFLIQIALPFFNQLAEKQIKFPWTNPAFWLATVLFLGLLLLFAGSYPALYLSSFQPVKVLKGKLQSSAFELFSRKGLVVFQFSVSIALIISATLIYKQIQFTKNRPLGYETKGLVQIRKNTQELRGNFYAMRQDLLNSGAVVDMAEINSPISESWHYSSSYSWPGKSSTAEDLVSVSVTPEFGNTLAWKITEGRDFSRTFRTDSSAVILNEAAVKLMGLQNPVNQLIRKDGKLLTVVGVVQNIVMDSPFDPVRPTVFEMIKANAPFITIRLKPELSASQSIAKMESVLKKYDPAGNFNYLFADRDYDSKFFREQRLANLTNVFAILAIFVSCLGLFGLASYVAEQRTKEIGIRKVLGATVADLWRMLSKDFIVLILISCLIAIPIAYYFMDDWLQKYTYRTEISWWVFVAAGTGALLLTLVTVSFQATRTALANPVKSLRSE